MSKKEKYIHEIPFGPGNRIPNDHPNAIAHHPCFEYESWHDYAETKNDYYHWDKWRSDEDLPDVHTNLKFRGTSLDNIMNEIQPYIRERHRNCNANDYSFALQAEWFARHEIVASHVGYKEIVKPEKHPTLAKITDWFEFEDEVQPVIMEKNPGNWEVEHYDEFDGHPSGYQQKTVWRIIIHLQDWERGQFASWGTKQIMQWKAGDTIVYHPAIPHATANSSRKVRYSLRITGVPSENTLQKMQKGGIINVDEL